MSTVPLLPSIDMIVCLHFAKLLLFLAKGYVWPKKGWVLILNMKDRVLKKMAGGSALLNRSRQITGLCAAWPCNKIIIRSHLGYAVAHSITDEHLHGCHCIVTPREGKQGRQSLRAPESNGPDPLLEWLVFTRRILVLYTSSDIRKWHIRDPVFLRYRMSCEQWSLTGTQRLDAFALEEHFGQVILTTGGVWLVWWVTGYVGNG